MSGRTEPDWNRWDPSLGRVQALPRMALLPMQGSTPDVRFELPGATGTLETTFLSERRGRRRDDRFAGSSGLTLQSCSSREPAPLPPMPQESIH
jgi:hypothetical protein